MILLIVILIIMLPGILVLALGAWGHHHNLKISRRNGRWMVNPLD